MIINNEYDYLIHLVKCSIRDIIPREIPDNLNFEKVYKYAVAHDVANLAFYALEKAEKKPDAELYSRWQKRRYLAVQRDINQEYAADEIRKEFREANIPWIEIQGTVMKKLYPATDYRTMSDIDFIVQPEKLEEAKQILDGLDYEYKIHSNGDIVASKSPNINVELHTGFFSNEYENVMPVPFEKEIGDEELCLYTILHLAKHYFESGCGIRRILDVYILSNKYPEVFKSVGFKYAFEKLGLAGFAEDVVDIADYWFGDGAKPQKEAEMKLYITKSNVHGSLEHKVENKVQESRFKYLWGRVFQSKEMIYLRYPFIKRCKILLPLGWLLRLVYGLTHLRQKGIDKELTVVKNIGKEKR